MVRLIAVALVAASAWAAAPPEQVHIALGGKSGEVVFSWVTMEADTETSMVECK